MSSNLFIGSSYELKLASELTLRGVVIATPMVDVGVDLIATCKDFKKFTPIQVKKKTAEKNIFFSGSEVSKYENKNIYIAYYLEESAWFMPFEKFLANAPTTNRDDKARVLDINKANAELKEFKNENGFNNMVTHILGITNQSPTERPVPSSQAKAS